MSILVFTKKLNITETFRFVGRPQKKRKGSSRRLNNENFLLRCSYLYKQVTKGRLLECPVLIDKRFFATARILTYNYIKISFEYYYNKHFKTFHNLLYFL